ncbi:MAG: 30S ribosomal protein S20 [Candidatus Vogelbacteria bacterium]|nr:30S ribosomal protein S20 [Candidatus Vogelbacteria bacterium]
MPITSSAKKAVRNSKKKRFFNLRKASAMKTAIKEIKKLVADKKSKEAMALLPKAYKAIDKAAKMGGIIKKNNAARKKSSLAQSIKKISK